MASSQRTPISPGTISSRLLTVSVVLVVVTATVALAPAAGAADDESSNETYSVTQGEKCTTITPIGVGVEPVEEFYDYRTPETGPNASTYSSHGTISYQKNDASLLFLHKGTKGLSLVVVHDKLFGGSPGGVVSMSFEDLPKKGNWVVQDDTYSENISGGPDDEFVHSKSASRITWVYGEGRTDGGAFRGGLDGDFEITISPRFNIETDAQQNESVLSEWLVLSDSPTGYTSEQLNLNRSITIQSGPCSGVSVQNVQASENVTVGESMAVEATVVNDGAQAGTFEIPISVDGKVVEKQKVSLESDEQATVRTSVSFDSPGNHTVTVQDETATVSVTEEDSSKGTQASGFKLPDVPGIAYLVAAGIVGLLAIALVAIRRR